MLCIDIVQQRSQAVGRDLGKDDKKKSSGKDAQLVLRLDREDRDAFIKLCKDLDTSASREVRHFIRDFLKKNKA
jgi:hypothetical protein